MPVGEAPAPETDPTTPLADAGDHAGVLDDDLEAAAAAAFSSEAPAAEQTPETPDDDDTTDGSTAAEEGELDGEGDGLGEGEQPSPASGEAPAEGEEVPPAGLTAEEIQQWTAFRDYLRENPGAAQAVSAALQQVEEPVTPPAPTAPVVDPATPPEGIDLDDPSVAALWAQHQATLEVVNRLSATVEQHDRFVQTSAMETTQSLLNQARSSFQEETKLTDSEMQTVYDVAGRLQVLPALMAPVDPITGVPRSVDPISAMKQAFEVARWNIPELRERMMQEKVSEQKADTKRKRKLASLGGSSGSTPRTPPVPTTPAERREAMIAEVDAMMQGEGAN